MSTSVQMIGFTMHDLRYRGGLPLRAMLLGPRRWRQRPEHYAEGDVEGAIDLHAPRVSRK